MEHIEKLQEHITHLEDQLKSNFVEIDKRFSQLRVRIPEDIDERLQELEDLLLLLQVESMSLKEKFTGDLETGLTPKLPSLEERLVALEAQAAGIRPDAPLPALPTDLSPVEERIRLLEEKISMVRNAVSLEDAVRRLEQRLDALEHQPAPSFEPHPYTPQTPKSRLFDDIQVLLKSN